MFMKTTKKPKEEAIPCVVRYHNGHLMDYSELTRRLFLNGEKFYIFPSRREAKREVHHNVELDKADGSPEPWNDYTMEEYEEE